MSLECKIKIVAGRAEKFRKLKESYSRGEYSTEDGFETNDFVSLKRGLYQKCWKGIEIPQDLIDEATNILIETDKLGFGLIESPNEEEERQNQARYVEYFRRCESVEKRLHQILSDYQQKHPEAETQN